MTTAGVLNPAGRLPLAFRTLQPEPVSPTRLLVLLHGVGGDERNLAALGAAVGDDTLVVLPRGPLEIGPGQYAWFRVTFAADGPRIVATEADASRRTLIDFVAGAQRLHGIAPARTVIAGFSQGGILSASVALTAPERVGAFAVLAGRILPELAPDLASPERLATLRGLVAHGTLDAKLPVDWAQRAHRQLDELGVAHDLALFPTGHGIDAAMRDAFLAWLAPASAAIEDRHQS